MMDKKQKIALVLLPVLSFGILFGCTKAKPEPVVNPGIYTDGTFEGVAKGFAGDIKVEVVVENGNIKEIKLVEHGETAGLGDKAMETVIASIVETQEVDVEIVTGATKSSDGVIAAVKAALGLEEEAAAPAEKTYEAMTFVDGTYEGSAAGFKGDIKVKVVVEGTKITAIDVLAQNETPSLGDEAIDAIIAQVIKHQNVDVDSVSGATKSSDATKAAIKAALEAKTVAEAPSTPAPAPSTPAPAPSTPAPAPSTPAPAPSTPAPAPSTPAPAPSTPAPAPAGQYKDGTYTASNKDTFYGETIKVTVTVAGGKITNVKFDTSDTPDFGGEAVKKIAASAISKQSASVDTVSGSTMTSKGAIKALQDAVNQAK